ncbi:hypothetical protein QC763_605415 [Podospora pseudopauciseta]|uniref:AT hook domain-containing protein n=1 Tax=Podospora pseudopauciseta TaxID=2093780 RepID=A0ABR0H3Q3_9PEZI|nr:hypothetical protein QC763_605415 [Podospora pseudopauciseta]
MAPREILDSEDDGDGFDDDQEEYGETLVPPDAAVEQQAAAPPATSAAINNVAATNIGTTALSTDSSFFERVYEGQYIAFDLEQPVAATTATATEMPPSTRKATGRAKAKTNDAVVDLTSPRKTDVWDLPGSSLPPTAEQGSRRSARKRAQVGVGVGEEEEDPYAFPESTPAAKRTRRSLGAAASPVALVGGVGMYVATSEMTASQKEQHVAVSLPNSSTSEVMGGTLPTLPHGEGQSSSGGTLSTIAYTTPSRIGSSNRRDISSMGGVGSSVGGGVGSGGGEIDTPARYQSSPDVLNDMAPPSTGSKRKARGKTDMEPPTSTASGRKTKKRRIIEDEEDGDFGAENDQSHVSEDISTEVIPQAEPEPQPKKKRGRKKKEPVPLPEEAAPDVELSEFYHLDAEATASKGQVAPLPDMEGEAAPEAVEPEPVVEEQAPVKKRRGRPKKAGTVARTQHVVIEVEEEGVEEMREPLAEVPVNTQTKGKKTPARKGKGGRKKKEVVVDSEEDGEGDDGEWGEKKLVEEQEEVAKEKKETKMEVKKVVKETKVEVKKVKEEKVVAGGTPIKPAGYRVGLSKRSRIAPLLKSLRKN